MMSKALLLSLLLATALSARLDGLVARPMRRLLTLTAFAYPYPADSEYEGGDYEEEEEVGDVEPPVFLVEGKQLVAKVGGTVTIPCHSDKSDKGHFVLLISKMAATPGEKEDLLFVDQIKVLKERRYKLNEQEVEISNLRVTDSGTYECKLQGSGEPIVVHHTLDVQYAPTVTAVSPAEQRVNKGASVKLECTAEGNPAPVISWSRQDGRLPSGAEKEEGDSIVLADVDRHVEGAYTCTANNGVGEASSSMNVAVEYQPEIVTEKAIIRSGEGDTVELLCIVHARPVASVTWTKEGQPLTADAHLQQHTQGHRHLVSITQVTEQDFGDYVCTATNTLGTAQETIHMTGLPKPPHFTSDPNGGEETTFTLTWDTESYYTIEAYRLRYRKTKANESSDEPGEWMESMVEPVEVAREGLVHSIKHTLEGLQAATDYEASVEVRNQFQWSKPEHFLFSTRKAPPTTTPTTPITTPPTTTPTMTLVEDNDGSGGAVQEVAGQQSTMLNGGSGVYGSVVMVLVSLLLLRAQ